MPVGLLGEFRMNRRVRGVIAARSCAGVTLNSVLSVVSTITGLDRGDRFEVLYHLTGASAALSVRIFTPREAPRIPSICAIVPGAILYERELQDMFGLVVEGIPDPRPLLLPDGWPAGAFPLRKDWTFERAPEVIPGGGK